MTRLGSMVHQAEQICLEINAIGTGRHEAKQEAITNGALDRAQANGTSPSHEINKEVGITSDRSLHQAISMGKQLGEYCKAEFGLRDLRAVTTEMVYSFCEHKLDSDIKDTSFVANMNSLQKFGQALGRSDEFHEVISDAKDKIEALDRSPQGAPFRDPHEVIAAMPAEYQTRAEVQLEGGLRLGDKVIAVLDVDKGEILVNGKGGKEHLTHITPELAARIDGNLDVLRVDKADYAQAIKEAADSVGQEGTSHSFRYSFVADRFEELKEDGYSRDAIKPIISQEMGHGRPEITEHYLRGCGL